jgi:hypothetical protein
VRRGNASGRGGVSWDGTRPAAAGPGQHPWQQGKQPFHPPREHCCWGKAAVVRLPVPALPLVLGRNILHTHEQYEEMAEVERRADRYRAIYGPRANR